MTALKGLMMGERECPKFKTLNKDASYQAVTGPIARSSLNRVPNR